MQVVFRADASLKIGTGHVMRCLSLADGLRSQGAECIFICRSHDGHLSDLINQRGYAVRLLGVNHSFVVESDVSHAGWLGADWETDARETAQELVDLTTSWLIVDHYALDDRWERYLRKFCKNLMVIDDLADRSHDCDFLLDQNLGHTTDDYLSLVPESALLWVGPQYALLRPEFSQLRPASLSRRNSPELKHLLITMGGVDKDNMTGLVLRALKYCSLPVDLKITVVMGVHAPWLDDVISFASTMPYQSEILVGVKDMATLMKNSDLAIGAAGSTSWERCCLGLPAIQLVLADNQKKVAKTLEESGAVIAVDSRFDLSDQLSEIFKKINIVALKNLSTRAASICDGSAVPAICSKLYELNGVSND